VQSANLARRPKQVRKVLWLPTTNLPMQTSMLENGLHVLLMCLPTASPDIAHGVYTYCSCACPLASPDIAHGALDTDSGRTETIHGRLPSTASAARRPPRMSAAYDATRAIEAAARINVLEEVRGQVRGQVRSGQVRSGQVRSGQVRSGQVRSGQVYYSAKIWPQCDHDSHKAAWATSEVSTGLNLATLE
jgi:hypothetical protein